jgi:hypothetical protein
MTIALVSLATHDMGETLDAVISYCLRGDFMSSRKEHPDHGEVIGKRSGALEGMKPFV